MAMHLEIFFDHDTAYITAVTEAEYKSESEYTKDSP